MTRVSSNEEDFKRLAGTVAAPLAIAPPTEFLVVGTTSTASLTFSLAANDGVAVERALTETSFFAMRERLEKQSGGVNSCGLRVVAQFQNWWGERPREPT